MLLFLIIIYLTLAVMVGWIGRKRAIGFTGWFILAIILTPPVASMIYLVSSPGAIL